MRWLTNFYDFRFKWTATAAIVIHLTKAWLSKLANFRNAIWRWGNFRRTICHKICFKLGKNATEMLQTAFGASCMNRASDFEWHKRFKECKESVRDDEKCGRGKEVNRPKLIGQRVRVRVTMLSQTIWPRGASRQFLTLFLVQTLLPVTFGYSLSSKIKPEPNDHLENPLF